MAEPLSDVVIRIVKKYANRKRLASWGSPAALRKARLYHDLEIYGDDAYDMFADLHNEFGTDFSDINTTVAFPPEGYSWNPFTDAWRHYFERKRLRQGQSTHVPITVEELIGIIESRSPRKG